MTATTAERARAAAIGAGLTGLVGALTPIWWVHDRTTRAITSRRNGGTAEIGRVAAGDADLDALLRGGRPVIVEGLVAELGLDGVCTRASLTERAGDRRTSVTFHDDTAPYFLYSGGYDTVPTGRRTMTLRELLDLMFDGGPDAGTVVYQLFGPGSLDGATADVLGEVDTAVRRRCSTGTETRFSGVWIGSTGVVTPLHHDAWPGVLFQTEGSKRVAMYAPRDRSNLSFRNPLAGTGRWSALPGRSADADPAEFPRLAHAVRHEARLDAGDALVIPPFWAHEVEALEPNISIPFRFAGSRLTYLNPGFLRPASELLRKQLHTLRPTTDR